MLSLVLISYQWVWYGIRITLSGLKGLLRVKYPSRQRAVAATIATARRQTHLSQRDLARKLKVPSNWIQRIESLERRVDVAEFIAIARALEVDPVALLGQVLKSSTS